MPWGRAWALSPCKQSSLSSFAEKRRHLSGAYFRGPLLTSLTTQGRHTRGREDSPAPEAAGRVRASPFARTIAAATALSAELPCAGEAWKQAEPAELRVVSVTQGPHQLRLPAMAKKQSSEEPRYSGRGKKKGGILIAYFPRGGLMHTSHER